MGLPSEDGDAVAVWGNSPTAHRGEGVAEARDAPIVRVEDALLRSLFPGRDGEPPLGLVIDHRAVHFDPSKPSDLEILLATHPLDDTALLNRARTCIARLQEAHLSKYAAIPLDTPTPDAGYVVVIDQTEGDASVTASGADRARFLEMLYYAQEEHPGARILIKTHPETAAGHRKGYFRDSDLNDRIEFLTDPIAHTPSLRAHSASTPSPQVWGSRRSSQAINPASLASPSTQVGASPMTHSRSSAANANSPALNSLPPR